MIPGGDAQKGSGDDSAYTYADGTQSWWQNGELHRVDGPASISADGSQSWWIDGRDITAEVEEWMTRMEIPPYDKWSDFELMLFRMISTSL